MDNEVQLVMYVTTSDQRVCMVGVTYLNMLGPEGVQITETIQFECKA